jgi:hypothetical protein
MDVFDSSFNVFFFTFNAFGHLDSNTLLCNHGYIWRVDTIKLSDSNTFKVQLVLLALAPCIMRFHYKVGDVLPISRALET